MPINYQNGKIYKIYSYENDDVYYGSTCEELSQRMARHRGHLKEYEKGKGNFIMSYEILKFESAKIELVENYPCNSKEELLQREGYYIRTNNCVNKQIAGRTKKEWYEENKDKIKQQQKEYIKNNREEYIEYQKQYRIKNREIINNKQLEYRIKNREIINNKQRGKKQEPQLILKEDINITNI